MPVQRLSSLIVNPEEYDFPANAGLYDVLTSSQFIHENPDKSITFMPPALLIIEQIKNLIRTRLGMADGRYYETSIPTLQSSLYWRNSDRDFSKNKEIMFIDARCEKYVLSAAPEDIYASLEYETAGKSSVLCHTFYQFGRKYRDETHINKLWRLREFTMFDAYTFSQSDTEARQHYGHMKNIFKHIMEELGITDCMFANSSPDFTQGLSAEELQVSLTPEITGEHFSSNEKSVTHEIGNLYLFGQVYDKRKIGKHMSAYSLGIERLFVACAAGSIRSGYFHWPASIRPFDIAIIDSEGYLDERDLLTISTSSNVLVADIPDTSTYTLLSMGVDAIITTRSASDLILYEATTQEHLHLTKHEAISRYR